jgi:hypothetical protein
MEKNYLINLVKGFLQFLGASVLILVIITAPLISQYDNYLTLYGSKGYCGVRVEDVRKFDYQIKKDEEERPVYKLSLYTDSGKCTGHFENESLLKKALVEVGDISKIKQRD